MMKFNYRELVRLLVGLSALLACCTLANGTTVIQVTPTGSLYYPPPEPPIFVNYGDIFTESVVVLSTSSIYGFDVEVYFPAFLNAISVTEGGFFAANGEAGFASNYTIDNSGGTISGLLDVAGSADPPDFPDTLFSIQFQVVNRGSGDINLECDFSNDCGDFPMLGDNSFNSIPVDELDFNFVDGTAASPPPAVPEPSTITAAAALLGLVCVSRRRRD